jgi:hypothetical protein
MTKEHLYHGAKGDNILGMIESGQVRPAPDGRLYFSRFDWEPTIQYGADTKRGASFAIALDVDIPHTAVVQREPTGGSPTH